jgi:DNA-binding CsgD family transcriptional regulator
MATLSANRIDDITRIADRALASASVHELQTGTLALMEASFRADACCFSVNLGPRWNPDYGRTESRGLDGTIWRLYRSYGAGNPFERWLARHACDPHAQVATTDRIVPFERYVRSDFYDTVMRPQSLHYTLGMTLLVRNRPVGGIALLRSRKRQAFGETEVTMAQLLVRALGGALEAALERETAEVREVVIDALEREVPRRARLIVDRSLQPLYANEAARRLLTTLGPGTLPPVLARACGDFFRDAREPDRGDAGISVEIAGVRRSHLVHARLRLLPRPGREEPWLLLHLASEAPPMPLPERAGGDALSARERDVAELLAAGLRNAEIGAELGITVRTVENHLRAIYRKLGVGNRTRAIRALARNSLAAA